MKVKAVNECMSASIRDVNVINPNLYDTENLRWINMHAVSEAHLKHSDTPRLKMKGRTPR